MIPESKGRLFFSNINVKAKTKMTTNLHYFFEVFQDQFDPFKHTDKKDQFLYQDPQTSYFCHK